MLAGATIAWSTHERNILYGLLKIPQPGIRRKRRQRQGCMKVRYNNTECLSLSFSMPASDKYDQYWGVIADMMN